MYKWLPNKIKDYETLSSIEKEILRIKLKIKDNEDLVTRLGLNDNQNPAFDMFRNERKLYDIEKGELHSQLEYCETKRQHKLDRRKGWVSKTIWSVLVPVVVIVVTAYILFHLGLKK